MRIESFPFLLILDPYPTILLMCVCVWNYIIFNAFFYYFKFQTIIFRARSSIFFFARLGLFFSPQIRRKKKRNDEIFHSTDFDLLVCFLISLVYLDS